MSTTDVAPLPVDLYAGQGLRLGEAAESARLAESAGFSGLWSLEASAEPFLALAIAAEHTERLQLRTAVAVAFARNPMIVAHVAHELNSFSGGRFQLGLGPQVRAHITRRFGEQWSRPADRMREFVEALHAIWACWNDGATLDFQGEFYTHTLMTPMFQPEPCTAGRPRVMLAAVGPKMLQVAAEVADGMIAHPLSSRRHLEEHTVPALRSARAAVGLAWAFEISCPVLVVTGSTEAELQTARDAVRKQIAFYASTSAYRSVLDAYGEGHRGPAPGDVSAGPLGRHVGPHHGPADGRIRRGGPCRAAASRRPGALHWGTGPGRPLRPVRRRAGGVAHRDVGVVTPQEATRPALEAPPLEPQLTGGHVPPAPGDMRALVAELHRFRAHALEIGGRGQGRPPARVRQAVRTGARGAARGRGELV